MKLAISSKLLIMCHIYLLNENETLLKPSQPFLKTSLRNHEFRMELKLPRHSAHGHLHRPLPRNPSHSSAKFPPRTLAPAAGRPVPARGSGWPAPPRSGDQLGGSRGTSPPPPPCPGARSSSPSASCRRRRRRSTARAARCPGPSWRCTRPSGSGTSPSSLTSTTASRRLRTGCWSSPVPSRRVTASPSTSTSCKCDPNSSRSLPFLFLDDLLEIN